MATDTYSDRVRWQQRHTEPSPLATETYSDRVHWLQRHTGPSPLATETYRDRVHWLQKRTVTESIGYRNIQRPSPLATETCKDRVHLLQIHTETESIGYRNIQRPSPLAAETCRDRVRWLQRHAVVARYTLHTSRLLQLSLSPKKALEGVEQRWSLCPIKNSKTDNISSHLASLHWLSIDSRIQYKLSPLCYNCLNSTVPDYLTDS